MREQREYRETLRGKYDIDWKGIHERANMLTNVKQRAEAYFSHMVGQGQVKDAHKDNTKYKQTMKSMKKDMGISKTEKEIDMFVKSRRL